MGRYYLKQLQIESFGAFSQRVVGPFSPGLNVVYGRNEAGKTTVAAFIGGVLYGWEDARSQKKNTYKPAHTDRAGSLFFAAKPDEAPKGRHRRVVAKSEVLQAYRGRNADGLQGEARFVVDDLDRETFRGMFSLTSDELRTLRDTTRITSRLLTAGSGTQVSPAAALSKVESDLAECYSRSASIPDSFPNLEKRRMELKALVAAEREKEQELIEADKELHELALNKEKLSENMSSENVWVAHLTAVEDTVARCDEDSQRLISQQEKLQEDLRVAMRCEDEAVDRWVEQGGRYADQRAKLVELSSVEERALEELLAEMTLEADRCKAACSRAIPYASLTTRPVPSPTAVVEAEESRPWSWSVSRTAAIAAGACFVAGIALLIAGIVLSLLPITVAGIALLLVAGGVAVAGAIKGSPSGTRPSSDYATLQTTPDEVSLAPNYDHQRTLLRQLATEHAVILEQRGLGEAGGSLTQAKQLLSESREIRMERRRAAERVRAVQHRIDGIEDSLHTVSVRRERTLAEAGLPIDFKTSKVTELLGYARKSFQSCSEELAEANQRYGELKQHIGANRDEHAFDKAKLEYQQVRAKISSLEERVAMLTMARQLLEESVETWEKQSQPAVYASASELFEEMTEGRWSQIRMRPEGDLQVVDSFGAVQEPKNLSYATRQQLYLALRIALLSTADNVGSCIPVLADDILVNFDRTRCAAAARALAKLAEHRQVIVFTCHGEVADTLQAVDPTLKRLDL